MKDVDAEARLNEVLLDSTRQQLAFVLQKGEWPIVIGMDYLDYVSLRDDDLKASLAAAFQQRLAAARRREEAE